LRTSFVLTLAASESTVICLLDDDPSSLKATSRLLLSAGWQPKSFDDPITFLRHAQAYSPPVAIIDVLMPRMNGLEVQRRLCKVSPLTRVVFLTGKDDPAVRSKALAAGASAFFLKGEPDDEFLAGVEAAISES
jgi:two-component system, LuxR family, response regulator FixJ